MKRARLTSLITILALGVMPISFSQTAFAGPKAGGDKANSAKKTSFQLSPSAALKKDIEIESDFIGLNSSLHNVVSGMALPSDASRSSVFSLDYIGANCVNGSTGCQSRFERLEMRYGKALTTSLDSNLDIVLTPRASVNFNDDTSSALVGALVRIGDDLRDNSEFKTNTWYMFAGADAEAVTYAPNRSGIFRTGNVGLQDRVIVGDAQAGLGYRMGDADITLGYFRREVTSFGRELNLETTSFTEDAAALSFTWRR